MGKNGRYVAKTTYAKQLKAAAQAEKGGAIVKSKGSAIVKSEGGAIVKDKGGAIVKDKGGAIVKNKGGAITKQGSSAQRRADFFTKPLPRKEFESFRKEIMNDTA